MKVFLAGGTGVKWLREQGAGAELCDVFDAARLEALVMRSKPDAVMHQMTDISPQMHPRRIGEGMSGTNRLRTQGARLLAEAAQSCGARRLIVQSIAFLYAPGHPSPAGERTPLYRDAPTAYRPMIDAVAQCEETALETEGIDGTVLRYGYFYGPGTIYARGGSFANGCRTMRACSMPVRP